MISQYRHFIALGLIVMLSFLFIRTLSSTYGLLTQSHLPRQPLTTSQEAPRMIDSHVAQWHLFGEATTSHQTNHQMANSVLTLEAIFIVTPNDQSRVILSQKSKTPRSYYQGDTIPGGATLKQILPNKIIIDNHGRKEKLTLPKDELVFAKPPQGLAG